MKESETTICPNKIEELISINSSVLSLKCYINITNPALEDKYRKKLAKSEVRII